MTYIEATTQVYYYYTIKDIADGIGIQEIRGYLKMYEEGEMYEVCLGIKKGLDFASASTMSGIELEVAELEETIRELEETIEETEKLADYDIQEN